MVWTPQCVVYLRAVRHLYPSIQWLEEGSWIGLPLLTLISPVDDVGFLEQLYFPIGSSFSCTTLHKDVTYYPIWNQNCCQNTSSILAEKNVGMTPRSMFVLRRDHSDLNGSLSWYIAQLNWVFHQFHVCWPMRQIFQKTGWGILVFLLLCNDLIDRHTLLHCTAQKVFQKFRVAQCVKSFKRPVGEFWHTYLFVNNAMTFVDSNLLASHS